MTHLKGMKDIALHEFKNENLSTALAEASLFIAKEEANYSSFDLKHECHENYDNGGSEHIIYVFVTPV